MADNRKGSLLGRWSRPKSIQSGVKGSKKTETQSKKDVPQSVDFQIELTLFSI